MALIAERVELARAGQNAKVIRRLRSGWAVMGDVQFLPGYCLLLADPVVPSLNVLGEQARQQFLSDMTRLGDALLAVTDALRINYEILGNAEPELHAHLFPRYAWEVDSARRMPAWFYDWQNAPAYSAELHGALQAALAERLVAMGGYGPSRCLRDDQ